MKINEALKSVTRMWRPRKEYKNQTVVKRGRSDFLGQ